MYWSETTKGTFLYGEHGTETLRILCVDFETYFVTLSCIPDKPVYKFVGIRSLEEAKWRAVLTLYDVCNQKANYYHTIRDHLPDIHDLAREAGI